MAVGFVPAMILKSCLLKPLLFATQGTIDGGFAAYDRGWAINFGGGFHHAHAKDGGGFCVYPDITLCIHKLRQKDLAKKAMIIDLDAH